MKNNSILFVLGRVDSFAAYLRGLLWRVLYFHNAKRLRVCGGCRFRGRIELGKNVYIGQGCSLEMDVRGSGSVLCNGGSCMCHCGNIYVIGERCTVNQNTLLIGSVSMGNDCVIAGNSVLAGVNHCFQDPVLL